jgi:hypothetical protein
VRLIITGRDGETQAVKVHEASAVVITPSIGSKKLETCSFSMASQTFKNMEHLIVFDGRNDHDPDLFGKSTYIKLTENTGAADGGPFYGHRIYAAFAHLVNADYVFFCDEDNWYNPDHVENAVKIFQAHPEVMIVHSLRKIHSAEGEYLLDDNCESLGVHKAYTGRNLADTSSLAFRRPFLVGTSALWHSGWGGDARYLNAVTQDWKETKHIRGTGKHTLIYRLDGNPNSVTKEFFERGNAAMLKQFGKVENFPWLNHSS